MTEIGYFLSSEEHDGAALVRTAQLAEEHGFDPWTWWRPPCRPPIRPSHRSTTVPVHGVDRCETAQRNSVRTGVHAATASASVGPSISSTTSSRIVSAPSARSHHVT
jgi:hypothetical protein